MRGADKLDEEARGHLAAEMVRHAEALRTISRADRAGLAGELDRHLDAVDAILAEHTKRRAGARPWSR